MNFKYFPINITKNCSAKCVHCPYWKSNGDSDLSLEEFNKTILSSDTSIILLTGGEPFEATNLSQIISTLTNSKRYFRLATGGHINLSEHKGIFKNEYFTGISLGFDVTIPRRSPELKYLDQWISNVKFLNSENIPYSLTIAIESAQEIDSVLEQLNNHKHLLLPSFLMVILSDPEYQNHIFNKIIETKITSKIIFNTEHLTVDLWGELCIKKAQGNNIIYTIERDDGKVSEEDISFYFDNKLHPIEKDILTNCKSPVLDIGCGPGRTVSHLKKCAVDVVGIDQSKGVVQVAKSKQIINLDIDQIDIRIKNNYGTVLLNGNNLGLAVDINQFKQRIKQYFDLLVPDGWLIGSSIDPTKTSNIENLKYQQENIKNNRYLGQTKIRLKHENKTSHWWNLLLLVPSDLEQILKNVGFKNISFTTFNHTYFVMAQK